MRARNYSPKQRFAADATILDVGQPKVMPHAQASWAVK
jgi:hypothetical protein